MGEDATIPPHRKQAVSVIKRGGEHLLTLIEGTLDMAQIERRQAHAPSQAHAICQRHARDGQHV
jgi:signal transduction histidine kinase